MPPPANPSSNKLLRQPLQQLGNGQRSSPFFSRAILESTTRIFPQAVKEQDLESDDEADKPSIFPKRAISTSKRRSSDSGEDIKIRSEAKKPTKSSAMQVVEGEKEDLPHVEPSERKHASSIDLDFDERRLYDRVSRKEANSFRSAKHCRESVEKRRKLGD